MCVIIHRPANITIAPSKIETACEKNSHGMGIAFFDRGRLEVRKFFNEKGNDPDQLNKILEELIEHEVFVHLRLKSIGDKNSDNCHPFIVYEDGHKRFALMHNGTMAKFDRKDGKTDSETFGLEIVQPMLKNWHGDNPLGDPDFQRIVSHIVGDNWNKVAIMDNEGHSFIINKGQGLILPGYPGVWVSNEHSFQSYFREQNFPFRGGTTQQVGKEESTKKSPPMTTIPTIHTASTASIGVKPTTNGAKSLAVAKQTVTIVKPENIKVEHRPRFLDSTPFTELAELSFLSETDILELVEQYPNEAALLILDLLDEIGLYEVYEGEGEEVV